MLTWYKLDKNSIPTVYVLMPVSSVYKNFTNKNEKHLMEEDQNSWWKTMGRLCTVIRNGSARLLRSNIFTPADNHRYNWSGKLNIKNSEILQRTSINFCFDSISN